MWALRSGTNPAMNLKGIDRLTETVTPLVPALAPTVISELQAGWLSAAAVARISAAAGLRTSEPVRHAASSMAVAPAIAAESAMAAASCRAENEDR